MTTFVASNGIELNEYGNVVYHTGEGGRKAVHEARKEFYQHLRDKELGRWRDPEAPNLVAYPRGTDEIVLMNETTGLSDLIFRSDDHEGSDPESGAARRYFEAHPEPKPWHDAEPGEIWVLEFGGDKRAYARTATLFTNWGTPSLLPTDSGIKSGYRIWPEGDTDAD